MDSKSGPKAQDPSKQHEKKTKKNGRNVSTGGLNPRPPSAGLSI
jgi:hypothetical protein